MPDSDWEVVTPAKSEADHEWESVNQPSVTDPKSKTLSAQLQRAGKTLAPIAAGAGTALTGARIGGEIGGPPGAIAGAVVGGVAAPFVQRGMQSAVTGQPFQTPSRGEVIQSAVTNSIFTGLGELGAVKAGSAAEVGPELSKLPQAERTTGKIRQIETAMQKREATATAAGAKIGEQDLRNRDFWKAHGLNDQQINEVLATPSLQQQLARSIEAGDRYKKAFESTRLMTGEDFSRRYTQIFEKVKTPTDTAPLGKLMTDSAQGLGEHELSPAFRNWLTRKGTELSGPIGEVNGPEIGGVPWKEIPPETQKKLIAQGVLGDAAKKAAGAAPQMTPEQLQTLRTELSENVPSSATNLDKKVAKDLHNKLTEMIQAPMAPEQRGALTALDAEYGRFQDVLEKLDPRSEKYGQQVANALFDPMVKDPETALNFVRMAKAADDVHGSRGIMGDFREAFLAKAMNEARVGGEPMNELAALRKLQDKWGGDKNARAVMGEMFGKDSPLADPATFTKVVEAANNPEPLAVAASKGNTVRTIMSSPYFQGMITFGVLSGLSGAKGGGVFMALTGSKGPEQQALAITAMLAGPVAIGWAVRSGNSPLQRVMVSYLTNPNAENAVKWIGQLTGSVGAATALPTPEETARGR